MRPNEDFLNDIHLNNDNFLIHFLSNFVFKFTHVNIFNNTLITECELRALELI